MGRNFLTAKAAIARLAMIAGTLLITTSIPASAQTGTELLENMLASKAADAKAPDTDWLKAGQFIGLIRGVSLIGQNTHFCLPADYDTRVGMAITERWLIANPERLNGPDAFLVALALVEAYPCPK